MNINKRFFCIGVIAAIAVLTFAFAFAASGSGVIDQNAEGVTVTASAVTTSSINYQGRLTDTAGEPLIGTYTMTFRLYEVASGGTALATDSHSITATEGLFNTEIDFDPEYFDGRELWLGITVGIDSEMTPRQELRPVPYALSLKPGANIVGPSSVALHAESTHASGSGIRGDVSATSGTNYGVVGESKSPDGYGGYFYNNEGGTGVYGKGTPGGYFTTDQGGTSWADRTAGVDVATTHDFSYGVQAHTAGDNSNAVSGSTSGGNSHGVSASTTGDNSNGISAYTAGNNSNGVWAYSDKHYGVYGKGGKYGGHFTTSQAGTGWDDKTAGVNVTTAYDYSYGVQAHTTGDYSTGVDAVTSGDHSLGVQAYTTGDSSDGVSASAWGENSVGIRAYSVKDYGVYGKGKSGGYFTTNQAGTSADRTAGLNVTTTYDHSDGVRASTSGYSSHGVSADTHGDNSPGFYAYTTGSCSHGVYASTSGYSSHGVSADTDGDSSTGVVARTYGDSSYGVYADTDGDYSPGVYAHSAKSYGVYGKSDSADHAGVYARGMDSGADLILGGNADTTVGDDGRIYSDPDYTNSDIFLITNDGIRIELDNDSDGEDADFEIRDKDNKLIFNVDESGDMYASGTKNAMVATKDYGTRKMYAIESTEVWFEDFGMTQLQDGVAVVEIDPVFAETVNLSVDYHVFFTPVDGWAPLFVANKTSTSFEIKDANDEANITLEYRLVARRLGYEDVRMAQVEPGNEEA